MPHIEQRTKASPDALASDRQRGREEAAAFERALRAREAAERRTRLAERTPGAGAAPVLEPHEREELRRLAAYVRMIHDSLGWRLLQRLRRLVGRAW